MRPRASRGTTFLLGALVLCTVVGSGTIAHAQPPAPGDEDAARAVRATLADLAFIAGHGVGELQGGVIEEIWSAPRGDSMMGMFAFTKDGRARFYEFLLIEQTASGPILRLKHFNPGLAGWEEKAEVFSYPLVSLSARRAVFERPDKDTRLTFDATEAGALAVTLDQKQKGVWKSPRFVYQRQ
jgi:Domain of unknown function (DUF6265)